MKRLERWGAFIFFCQVVCGGVVYLGTAQDSVTLALFAAAVAGITLSLAAILYGGNADIAVGLSASAAPLAVLFHFSHAYLAGPFSVAFVLISFGTAVLAAMLVKSEDETFIERLVSVLPVIGGLKYLNARVWGRWLRSGSAR